MLSIYRFTIFYNWVGYYTINKQSFLLPLAAVNRSWQAWLWESTYKLSGDTCKAELVLIRLLVGGGRVNHTPGENSDQAVIVLLSPLEQICQVNPGVNSDQAILAFS